MGSTATATAAVDDFVPPTKDPELPMESCISSEGGPSALTVSTSATSIGSSSEEYNAALNHDCDYEAVGAYFTEARIQEMKKRADEENERLNLNLGLPVDLTVFTRRDGSAATGLLQKVLRLPTRTIICLLDRLLAFVPGWLMLRFGGDAISPAAQGTCGGLGFTAWWGDTCRTEIAPT